MELPINLQKHLYIPIELKDRELDSQVILAAEACLKGFRVYLGSHAAIYNSLSTKFMRAGIYLDKGTQTIDLTKWIHGKCESIFILDQELNPSIEETYYNLGKNPVEGRIYLDTKDFLDGFFCVGPIIYKFAREFFGSSERIFATGWPRIDIQTRYANLLYSKRIFKLKEKYGDFLLFVSDFGVLTQLSEITQPKRLKALLDFEGEEFYKKSYADLQVVLNLLRLWDADPHVPTIIVRPHLVEDVRIWKKLLYGLTKTIVIQKGDITPWISASSGIIHRGSTVSIQAKLMGKPVFFVSDASRAHDRKIVNEISDEVVSESKPPIFLQLEKTLTRSQEELISQILFYDTESAAEKIIRILNNQKLTYEEPISAIRVFHNYFRLRAIRRALGLARDEIYYVFKDNYQAPQSKNLPRGIRRRDVKFPLIALNKSSEIKVRRIGLNLWEFSSK